MTNELCKWMKVTKEPRRFEERCCNENHEYFLATEVFSRDKFALGENIMPKRLLIALLGAGFACATLSAQERPLIHQPTLTPQDSGTTNGLIAVWPVNPQVVWASGRNGTFTVTTDGGETWHAGVVPGAEALQFRDAASKTRTRHRNQAEAGSRIGSSRWHRRPASCKPGNQSGYFRSTSGMPRVR